LTTSRRRMTESIAVLPLAEWTHFVGRSRRSGEVACANKPCAVCVRGRQTGDTNGDCLFDVRDVTYQRDYLNLVASSVGVGNLALLPIQLGNLDADQNGLINTQDVDFLLKVNFGLYNFVRNLSVQGFSGDTSGGCGFNVSAAVFGGGGGGGDQPVNPATTFVYFDLESVNPVLSKTLADAIVVSGSSTGIVKGPGYYGSLYRAQWTASGVYVISLISDVLPDSIGASVLQGTVNLAGIGSNARTTPLMTGYPIAPFLYDGLVSFILPINTQTSVSVYIANGYNPFLLFTDSGNCVSTATTTITKTSTSTTMTGQTSGASTTTTTTSTSTTTTPSVCVSFLTLDVVFVVGSLSLSNWAIAKQFVADVVNLLPIGSSDSRLVFCVFIIIIEFFLLCWLIISCL
jgi:hypothetical protein